jgi:hypothetical protein
MLGNVRLIFAIVVSLDHQLVPFALWAAKTAAKMAAKMVTFHWVLVLVLALVTFGLSLSAPIVAPHRPRPVPKIFFLLNSAFADYLEETKWTKPKSENLRQFLENFPKIDRIRIEDSSLSFHLVHYVEPPPVPDLAKARRLRRPSVTMADLDQRSAAKGFVGTDRYVHLRFG